MLSLYLQMLDSEEERSRFERFYLRYRDVMFRVAIKLLHSEMDAEDAVHQAFLYVIMNLNGNPLPFGCDTVIIPQRSHHFKEFSHD